MEEDIEVPEDLIEIKDSIMDWLEYKKERGQKYKSKGLIRLWPYLRKIPKELRKAAIDNSMAFNYSGIFPPKGGQNGVVKGASAEPSKYAKL